MRLYTIIVTICIINGVRLAEQATDPANNETSSNNEDDDDTDYRPVMHWSDTFDWHLLKAISNEHHNNVLISPLSIKLALVILYEGSEGSTKKQFQSVMQYPEDKNELREQYKNLLTNLEKYKDDYIINIGTRLFLESTIPPKQAYTAAIKSAYNTIVQPTNFSNPIETGNIINSWVEKLTDGHIKELINAEEIQDDSLLVVANAVYFKGKWRRKFPIDNTHQGGFYVSPTKVVNVEYMTNTDTYFYGESKELDAKLLRLPYKGRNFGFFIVLPNSKGGLSELMNSINLYTLKKQLYIMDERKVDVVIPKFKFEFSAGYSKILQDFGLLAMFTNTASFPGIARGVGSGSKWLFVNDLKQKTGIEFNEEGSTAFAATEIQLGNKFGESDAIFNATHPFLFFIEHQETGSILFSGKIVNPLEGDPVDLPSRSGETVEEKPSAVSN